MSARAVSYTHLDVYKRQLSGNVKKSVYKRVFDADFDERITVVNLLLSGLTAVSYTHLDVYKRQALCDSQSQECYLCQGL